MSKMLRLEIVNPAGKVYDNEIHMIIARATTGEMGILPGHAPLIALLDHRPVRILTEEGEQQIMVQGGILQVKPDSVVTILTSG